MKDPNSIIFYIDILEKCEKHVKNLTKYGSSDEELDYEYKKLNKLEQWWDMEHPRTKPPQKAAK